MKNNLDINKCLGLSEPQELIDYIYKLMNVFKFSPMLNQELGTQLVKNLAFMLKQALSGDKFAACLNLGKLFSRCSFIGRKLMLNVTFAKERLSHIVLFFQVSF